MPLHERARLAGVAVDAVFDSVSVATTFKEKLAAAGVIFCRSPKPCRSIPSSSSSISARSCRYTDNYFATLNSAVFTDGSFVYVPKGVRCPMELSTYFRINAINTGQFERTLIIAEQVVTSVISKAARRRSATRTSCTPPSSSWSRSTMRTSSIRRCRTGIRATAKAAAASTTSSPSAASAAGATRSISWTQVETGSAITWKYPSCVLRGDDSIGEFYSVATVNNLQQADTGTKMIHIGRNTRSTIVSKGISAGHGQNTYRGLVKMLPSAHGARNFTQCDSLLMGKRCGAHTFPYVEVKNPTATVEHEATTSKISDDQLFYCLQRGISAGGCGQHDRQRLLQVGVQGAADGVRGRSAEPARREPRRSGGMIPHRRIFTSASATRKCSTASPSHVPRRRGARHHGPQRLGQEHARAVLAGTPGYEVDRRHRHVRRRDLLAMAPEERARAGVFLGFQYPVEIPGVNNVYLLKAARERGAQASRPARGGCLRVPRPGAREDEAHADG